MWAEEFNSEWIAWLREFAKDKFASLSYYQFLTSGSFVAANSVYEEEFPYEDAWVGILATGAEYSMKEEEVPIAVNAVNSGISITYYPMVNVYKKYRSASTDPHVMVVRWANYSGSSYLIPSTIQVWASATVTRNAQ